MIGRWEALILERVGKEPGGFWLREILPQDSTLSDYVASCRAARGLAKGGFIVMEWKKYSNRERVWLKRGRRKLPSLPHQKYIMARIRLPLGAAKE